MSTDTVVFMFGRVLPAAVLVGAFVGICGLTGTWWPWTHVVHEDGVRTLLGTIFFFEHAARELVTDLVLALGVAGAVRWFFPPSGMNTNESMTAVRKRLFFVAGLVTAAIVIGTVRQGGLQELEDNLTQQHTRAGALLVWGAHWRYHFLERFAELMLALSVVGILWILKGRPEPRAARGRRQIFALAVGLFVVLTLVFHVTAEPFREPTFLGHQARELFTHTLVTIPLALGVCLGLARRFGAESHTQSTEGVMMIVFAGGASAVTALYLLAGSVLTGARDHGQTTSLAGLVFPHFAEHALGYVLVPALAGACYLLPEPLYRSAAISRDVPKQTVRTL